MNRTRSAAGLAIVAALCLSVGSAASLRAQAAAGQEGAAKPQYTMAEYNSYQACATEKNPAAQVKCLDDFAAKYPNSQLMTFVLPLYVQAYSNLKNYPKVIEYADKTAALGDKVDAATRYNAYYTHAVAWYTLISDPNNKAAQGDAAMAKSAQDAVDSALKTLPEVKKPENVADDVFNKQKETSQVTLNGIGAQSAMIQKDYPKAVEYYKAVLALDPEEPVTNYRLGQAYLAMTPPQTMDAFWYVARAISSKKATQQQVTSLKTYLRKLIANYQQAACDNLTDAELAELIQLAGSSPTRPETYKLPSVDDLTAARKDMTIASVIADLKAGGDKGKVTWLAACGLEFPDVPGKLIEITPGSDSVELKVAFVTNDAEFQAATTPNMDVKIVGQPEAARLEKDNPVRFTATLVSYDPDPNFMLHWDKGKVNAEDIPKEKEAPKRPTRRPPPKRPGGRSN
jgi:tetratricopeptide (TPR) repeat protein